jgi:hypothetical protein
VPQLWKRGTRYLKGYHIWQSSNVKLCGAQRRRKTTLELTETEKIKCAAPSEVARWVSAAWKAIPESIIVRSLKKCCISNDLDGSEDDIVWEDDDEDKDNSDWVASMDNDSVTSDNGKSDE